VRGEEGGLVISGEEETRKTGLGSFFRQHSCFWGSVTHTYPLIDFVCVCVCGFGSMGRGNVRFGTAVDDFKKHVLFGFQVGAGAAVFFFFVGFHQEVAVRCGRCCSGVE